jgi:hypothetical protein
VGIWVSRTIEMLTLLEPMFDVVWSGGAGKLEPVDKVGLL